MDLFLVTTKTTEAIQVTPENIYDIAEWVGGDVFGKIVDGSPTKSAYVNVIVGNPKSNHNIRAWVGAWVLRENSGYFRVFSDEAFYALFQPANYEPFVADEQVLFDLYRAIEKQIPNKLLSQDIVNSILNAGLLIRRRGSDVDL